jgi:hypothetical protein
MLYPTGVGIGQLQFLVPGMSLFFIPVETCSHLEAWMKIFCKKPAKAAKRQAAVLGRNGNAIVIKLNRLGNDGQAAKEKTAQQAKRKLITIMGNLHFKKFKF